MKKKLLIIISTILVVVIASIFIFAPFYIKYYINENGKELTGRKISIDRFYFNILDGNTRIENFRMYEEDDNSTFIQFDTLKVNLTIYKLFAKELYIEDFTLDQPLANVNVKNKVFNFDSLIPNDSTAIDSTSIDATQESGSPFIKYSLNNFKINSGDVHYSDLDEKINHSIKDFDVILPHIAWGENDTKAGLEFKLGESGKFKTNIHYITKTGDFTWLVNITNLNLHEFLPYAQKEIKLSNLEGKLHASISIKGNLDKIAEPLIKGKIGIDDFAMIDNENFNFFNFSNLKITSNYLNAKNMEFFIDTLYMNNVNASYYVYEKLTNIDRLFYDRAQELVQTLEDSVSINKEGDVVKWKISNLLLEKSQVNFSDFSLKPKAFEYSLSNININAENVEFGNRAKIIFLSDTPNGGNFNAEILTDPGDFENGQFNLFLKNIDTKGFSPYSLYYFAYPITGGKYNFSIKNNVKDNHINSRMIIDAYSTKLDKKRKDLDPQMNVPLKTALFILRDKDDRVNLDIAMDGNLDDPDFKYGRVILKIFTNNLIKLVASPFNFLAKSLGVSSDKIKEVKFDELQLELGPSQTTQLDVIAKLLKDKNPLKADLQLYADKEDEIEKLIIIRAKSYFYLKNIYNNDTLLSKLTSPDYAMINDIDIDDIEFGKYLSQKLNIPIDSLENTKMCESLVPMPEADSLYNYINQERIKNVEKYLSAKDSIIYNINSGFIDKSITGNRPYFELKYTFED